MRYVFLALVLCTPPTSKGYSVLTHEAIIDSAWDDHIQPLLQQRFPTASAEDLVAAHGYSYGGCIIQDMGYYPFGSKFFSDLTHYVRSGHFVEALLREARDLNEFAFALGALAHYASDTIGHPVAVNRSVPILYPKLKQKYGDVVTYAQNPKAHMKAEFGFDVLQVARGNYAPNSYRDFIGFKVSEEVLERAFLQTYSLEMKDVFANVDLAIGTYRRTVSDMLPLATKIAWQLKKDELIKATPDLTEQKFLFNLSRANYEKEWGTEYKRPGIVAKILAFFFRVIPKVGPFRGVSLKPPSPETEQMFMLSVNKTLDFYRALVRDVQAQRLKLKNLDCDTGEPVRAGEYVLADRAYAKLLDKFSSRGFERLSSEMRADILEFYRDARLPAATKPREWRKTLAQVDALRRAQPVGQSLLQ